jgi:hypothetical protein
MLVGSFASERVRAIVPAAMLLFMAMLFVGACSDKTQGSKENNHPTEEKAVTEQKTSPPATRPETTGPSSPPEVTLGDGPRGKPEVLIRLEGDPNTTFSGLCSVGEDRNVLSGQVPKRYAFDLNGRRLSCRIEKRGAGDLKVVLVAGETTRSVQQINAPGGVINVSYDE